VWNGHPKPFHLPNLNLVSDVAQSQAINQIHGGAIIIAGSGMCTGGRIVHHLRQNLARRNAHVLIVGYQANGTLGRRLVDRAGKVRIFGEDIVVNADIHTVGGLSAHADQPQLLAWYGGFKNKPPVLLVHGEDGPREALQAELSKRYGCTVSLAQFGQRVAV
jgi:metallo-beta-lactamase family protein